MDDWMNGWMVQPFQNGDSKPLHRAVREGDVRSVERMVAGGGGGGLDDVDEVKGGLMGWVRRGWVRKGLGGKG